MKKTFLFSSALVALAMLASCQKEEFVETPATATGVTEFTATIESTKTSIDATDGKVTWTAGDEITVTDAASKSAVYVATSFGESTTFTLKQGQTAVGSGPYKATYGDITKQKYSANGANCPLTAQSSTTNFTFSSPYAVVKLTAKSSGGETIKTVVVTYGGKGFSLDCGEGVTLTSAGVDFYVAIESASKNALLSVTFYNTAEKMATRSRKNNITLAAKALLSVTFDSFTWENLTSTFKAVHNTTDGTLTFYYDNSLHIGEGVLYDNLPSAATGNASWGYDGVRKEIKEVAITESVKHYSGLTSTACMFYNMTIASSIEGAEHLTVSNVTNMMAMFWNFGSNSSTLKWAPKVDNWNTGEVENMQSMFMNYGAGPKDFNDVPNVSNWDTRKVKNMNGMFKGFASTSEELECAPKVNGTNWKTNDVTDMRSMFCGYGKASDKLKEAPDVSSWNTQNVTKMGDMFLDYGYTSTALDTAPDVSGWNTINVTTMTNMFQNYGYSSNALSTVPNVSNWETGNVTSMVNMFNGYGYTSTNISCVLDLSGWDLSIITSGGDVFKFNPKTFDVTIPAKTGEKSNEGDKWYYGDGTNFITPPTNKEFEFTLATN